MPRFWNVTCDQMRTCGVGLISLLALLLLNSPAKANQGCQFGAWCVHEAHLCNDTKTSLRFVVVTPRKELWSDRLQYYIIDGWYSLAPGRCKDINLSHRTRANGYNYEVYYVGFMAGNKPVRIGTGDVSYGRTGFGLPMHNVVGGLTVTEANRKLCVLSSEMNHTFESWEKLETCNTSAGEWHLPLSLRVEAREPFGERLISYMNVKDFHNVTSGGGEETSGGLESSDGDGNQGDTRFLFSPVVDGLIKGTLKTGCRMQAVDDKMTVVYSIGKIPDSVVLLSDNGEGAVLATRDHMEFSIVVDDGTIKKSGSARKTISTWNMSDISSVELEDKFGNEDIDITSNCHFIVLNCRDGDKCVSEGVTELESGEISGKAQDSVTIPISKDFSAYVMKVIAEVVGQ